MSIVASADICVRSACMERNESTISRFEGGDIIEENINKAFKPMKMIAEKIPTVAICGMGKSINNLAKEIIKAEEEYIKMEQMKVLGLNEEILNCKSTLTLEELNKMFSEIDTEIIDTESISNLKKRIRYCKNPMERKQLEQELNVLYKEQKRKRKNVKNK